MGVAPVNPPLTNWKGRYEESACRLDERLRDRRGCHGGRRGPDRVVPAGRREGEGPADEAAGEGGPGWAGDPARARAGDPDAAWSGHPEAAWSGHPEPAWS